MYKLLIVDDEAHIREGLSKFDWNSLGIVLDGVCEHGLAAYQWIIENPVDIILCDIRMPIMGGLELIEQVNRFYPYIKIVVLTGYSDFEYVRTCLRYGVTDYLMKPIDTDELTKTFTRVLGMLNREKQLELKMKTLERRARFSTKARRQEFFRKLFSEPLEDEEIEEECSYCELTLDAESYTVCILGLDNPEDKDRLYTEREWSLIVFAFDKMLSDLWEDRELGYYWVNPETGNCYLLVTDVAIQSNANEFNNTLENLKQEIYRIRGLLRTTLSIAVGSRQYSIHDIPKSAYHAENTLRNKTGDDQILYYSAQMSNIKESDYKDTGKTNDIKADEVTDLEGKQYIIKKAKEYINAHFTRSITLGEVAEHVYINPSYLSYLFKEATGYNFIYYLTNCRIEKAKELLKDPRYKVYEISEMVGYENPRYFSKIFKKTTGKTPYEYRSGH